MAANSGPGAARPEEARIFRAVADIAPLLWENVERLSPHLVARNAGVRFEEGKGFYVPFMGGEYVVDVLGRSVETPPAHRPAGFQKGLVLLAYLAGAMDIGLSGKMVSGRELNGGDMFFVGPHAFLTAPVVKRFGRDPEGFLARAAELGFAREDCGSGFGCRAPVLPNIAVGCVLHPEDDEFEAELTYTFDSYANYHLPLDAIWAMINVLAEELPECK